jgi:hypothetical protein
MRTLHNREEKPAYTEKEIAETIQRISVLTSSLGDAYKEEVAKHPNPVSEALKKYKGNGEKVIREAIESGEAEENLIELAKGGKLSECQGFEAQTYLHKKQGCFTKLARLNNGKGLGDLNGFLREKVHFYNMLFPETRYEVLGLSTLAGEEGIALAVSQKAVKGIPFEPEKHGREFAKYMKDIGFKPKFISSDFDDSNWSAGDLNVTDLRPPNIIVGKKKDEEGYRFYIIDPQIWRNVDYI